MSGCSSSTSNSRATANSDDSECVKLCGRQRRRLQRQHPRQQNDRRVFLPSHCNDTPTGFFRIGTSSGLWRWRIGKTSLSSFSTSERLGCMKSLGSSLSSHLPQIRVHQALHQRVRPVYAELAVDEQKLHNVVEPLIVVEGGFLDQHGADNALQDPSVVFARHTSKWLQNEHWKEDGHEAPLDIHVNLMVIAIGLHVLCNWKTTPFATWTRGYIFGILTDQIEPGLPPHCERKESLLAKTNEKCV